MISPFCLFLMQQKLTYSNCLLLVYVSSLSININRNMHAFGNTQPDPYCLSPSVSRRPDHQLVKTGMPLMVSMELRQCTLAEELA